MVVALSAVVGSFTVSGVTTYSDLKVGKVRACGVVCALWHFAGVILMCKASSGSVPPVERSGW